MMLPKLVWPFLHFVGRSKEPDEAMFLPIVVGGPAFLVAHVLAIEHMGVEDVG